MKKTVYTLALFLALCCCGQLHAQNDNTHSNAITVTQSEPLAVLQQNITRPITRLQVKGKSAVQLFRDTTNYVKVMYNPQEGDPLNDNFIVIQGMTLTINDTDGDAVYIVHLKDSDLQFISHDLGATIIYGNTGSISSNSTAEQATTDTATYVISGNLAREIQIREAKKEIEKAKKEIAEARKELRESYLPNNNIISDSINTEELDEFLDTPIEVVEEPSNEYVDIMTDDDSDKHLSKHYYDWEDRTQGSFLWGFNNWGDTWYNGLSKMDGAYNLKTSFSSWQLDMNYSLIMTRHFHFSVGLGYESDIYKFSTPLIDIDNNGNFFNRMDIMPTQSYSDFLQNNQEFNGTSLNDWSTRLVTRYISLPVSVGFRYEGLKIRFTALPALAFSTSHTGLKHEIDEHGLEYQDVQDISKFIKPYKLDLRLDMSYDGFGVFIQTSTTSLFTNGATDTYPIKIGFILTPTSWE